MTIQKQSEGFCHEGGCPTRTTGAIDSPRNISSPPFKKDALVRLKCTSLVSLEEAFGLRSEHEELTPYEEYQLRVKELKGGLVDGIERCYPVLRGKRICVKGYSSIMGINYRCIARLVSTLRGGGDYHPPGRPSGQRKDNYRVEHAYAFLLEWIKYAGDAAVVPGTWKWSIFFLSAQDVHNIYKNDFDKTMLGSIEGPLSLRRFREVWKDFKGKEKVRIRRKCNITTKCEGSDSYFRLIFMLFVHFQHV